MFIPLLYKRGLGYLILSYQQALLVTQTDKLIKLPQDRVVYHFGYFVMVAMTFQIM
jgi:hypothetical protein